MMKYTRNVLFYPVGYNVDGGLLVIKPSGEKEFNVRDHIGNVRATMVWTGRQMQFKHYDFKPFGDTLSAYGDRENGWKGFNGESKDLESSFMNMGARIYDPSIGRFLSVDPLLDFFPNQSPFSYAYNNPISYRDPSGLAPEKEKGNKNQIQGWFSDLLASIFGGKVEEQNAMDGLKKNVTDDGEVENKEEDRLGSSGGSGGSSSSGSGAGIGSVGMGAGVNVVSGVSGTDGTASGIGGGYSSSMQYSFNGLSLNVNFTVNNRSDIANASNQITNSMNWIANAGNYGCEAMTDFISAMNMYSLPLNINLTKSGIDLKNLWNLSCNTNKQFILGLSSNHWRFSSSNGNSCDVAGIDKGSIYIANNFLKDGFSNRFTTYFTINSGFWSKTEYVEFDFKKVFAHEFRHKYDSMFNFLPFDKEGSAEEFLFRIYNYYNP